MKKGLIKLQVAILLFGTAILFSCAKPETKVNCNGEKCFGTQSIFLTSSNYYLDKDTVFKFVNAANDTILLSSQPTYTTFVSIKDNCPCANLSTNLSSQNLFKNYVFKNKNVAMQFHIGTNYLIKVVFAVTFADTNDILHQIHTVGDTIGSNYSIADFHGTNVDFSSLYIRGKYYYNVFYSFSQFYFATYSKITNIYYAKGLGIIRFTYNNTVYDII
jgi:hypothetical protein